MRKLPWLIPLLITTSVMAQRGGTMANRLVPYLPTCVATTGSCPADGYVCVSGVNIYRCTSTGGYEIIGGGSGLNADPDACTSGQYVSDLDITATLTCSQINFSVLAGTLSASTQLADDTITPNHVLSAGQTDGYVLSYESNGDTWAWISPVGATGDSVSIDTAAVVNPDFVSTGDIDFVDTSNTVTANINAGSIVNADINASAAIVDTKLATISTASKVSNSATTAASANTASAIVARDASGNFTAGTITAALSGNATTASGVTSGTAPTVTTVGNVGVDTTEDQLKYYGGAARVLTYKQSFSFALESPADADNFLVMYAPYDMTVTGVHCIVDPAGTGESVVIDVQERDSTGDNPATVDATITCDNDGAADDGTLTNPTVTEGEWISIDIGAVTGTVTQVVVTVEYEVTAK